MPAIQLDLFANSCDDTPSHFGILPEVSLGYWGQMAQEHWEKFLPKYYQSLQEQGTLEKTLQEADLMGLF